MEFAIEHRKSTSFGGCCVNGCDSKVNKNFNLSFHTVPKAGSVKITRKNLFGKTEVVDKRTEWLRKLNIKEENRKYLLVCSLHFDENDYWFPEINAKARTLKRDAIPKSFNVPIGKIKKNVQRQKRLDERLLKKQSKPNGMKGKEKKRRTKEKEPIKNELSQQLMQNVCKVESVESIVPTLNDSAESEEHESDCEKLDEDEIPLEVLITENNFQDLKNIETLVEESSAQISNDKSLQVGDQPTLCSFIRNEKDLMTICNIKSFKVLDELTQLIDKIYSEKKETSLSTRENIVLTTAKLKLDISFSALTIFFNKASDLAVRNIFYDTVKKLASVLQSVVRRVPKEEMEGNRKCFESPTSVLDWTEIRIEKPKCLKCRSKFYSLYKDDLRLKFIREVTREGLIVCVSESFEGSAADKCIFNQSIASARVDIERVNERVRQFEILNHNLPWFLINYIDDIFLVCCGLSNVGTSIHAN